MDRSIVLILLIGLAAASAVVFLVATGVLSSEVVIADEVWRRKLLGFAEGPYRVLATVGALAVGLASIVSFLRRLSRGPLTTGAHILTSDESGVVVVEAAAIEALALTAVTRTRGVFEGRVRVSGPVHGPVDVHVGATVHGGAPLERVGNGLRSAVRRIVEDLGGLEVRDVTVRLRVAPRADLEVALR